MEQSPEVRSKQAVEEALVQVVVAAAATAELQPAAAIEAAAVEAATKRPATADLQGWRGPQEARKRCRSCYVL